MNKGDKTQQVPAKNILVKFYRFFNSSKVHYVCGGKWGFEKYASFGHIETCNRCGEQCYESDY